MENRPPPEIDKLSQYLHYNLYKYKQSKFGFTLAEVLITIGIIGIVAALTLPSVIGNYKEKETITKLKKVYATLSVANQVMVIEHGTDYTCRLCKYDLNSAPSGDDFRKSIEKEFIKNLNITRECPPGIQKATCFSPNAYGGINSNNYGMLTTNNSYLLQDGTAIQFNVNGDTSMEIVADINGKKGPNKYGIDTFHFEIDGFFNTKGKLLPVGSPLLVNASLQPKCNRTVKGVQIKTCTAWVLTYENMDYLHCDELEWDKKTKCD